MDGIKRFLSDEKGTETVEWAIMIGIIAVAAIATIVSIGGWVKTQFDNLNNGLNAAGS
jgi:pilus assembly protein Flp/PilA